jgi:lipopolysaccharide transport system permease protein
MILTRILDVRAHWGAGREIAALVRQRAPLILAMTVRDLKDRYAGQALGVTWAVLAPLLMMAVYLLAFSLIFKGRIGAGDDGSAYTAYLLAGLVPWMTLQEILSRATTAITGQANLVKQIVFPSEVLPLRVALAALPTMGIGLAVIIPVALWSGRWSVLGLVVLLPLCLACFVLLTAGVAFWLAAIGVFLRDIKDIIGFLMSVGLFLHPVLYPPGAAPAWLEAMFLASPFSHMLWCFRDALVAAAPQPTWSWLIYPLASVVIFTTGWRGFRMMKPTFGNVL